MKVGTDAILLGNWAQINGNKSFLEVGTGCGVISLLLASRCSGNFHIDAIDIHSESVIQASDNFNESPWGNHLIAHEVDFMKWTKGEIDHIISNPPFFAVGPESPTNSRANARHQKTLTLESLVGKAWEVLKKGGRLSLIIPYENKALLDHLPEMGWTVTRVGYFRPFENKPFNRMLIECIKKNRDDFHTVFQVITHYNSDGTWHPDYLRLAGDCHHPDNLNR